MSENMFNNKNIAEQINQLMLDYRGKLSESMQLVRDNCTEDEIHQYRKALGKIIGSMIIDVMEPIYDKHPDIKPSDIK